MSPAAPLQILPVPLRFLDVAQRPSATACGPRVGVDPERPPPPALHAPRVPCAPEPQGAPRGSTPQTWIACPSSRRVEGDGPGPDARGRHARGRLRTALLGRTQGGGRAPAGDGGARAAGTRAPRAASQARAAMDPGAAPRWGWAAGRAARATSGPSATPTPGARRTAPGRGRATSPWQAPGVVGPRAPGVADASKVLGAGPGRAYLDGPGVVRTPRLGESRRGRVAVSRSPRIPAPRTPDRRRHWNLLTEAKERTLFPLLCWGTSKSLRSEGPLTQGRGSGPPAPPSIIDRPQSSRTKGRNPVRDWE